MSNAFDEMMRKKDESPHSTSSSGRPMHEHWAGYKKLYVKEKVAAKCLNCLKTFTNTAKVRMVQHR